MRQILLIFLVTGLLFGAGCARKRIKIGSKNFTEQIILAEIMAQLIEAQTDQQVKVIGLGGTMICHNALSNGDIDLYSEYTGTALTAILKQDVIADPDAAYEVVAKEYPEKFGCKWLKPFGFNNTYAVTVRKRMAAEKGLEKVSDLKPLAGSLKAGFTGEFMERDDGYPGLQKEYGFEFEDARDMDPSLMYQAVEQGNVDVICAFATDGRIDAYDLKMLEDDKGFFPPYYAAPVVRSDTLDANPGLQEVLELLGGLVDDAQMRQLNNQVDKDKKDPAVVAEDFLRANGLL